MYWITVLGVAFAVVLWSSWRRETVKNTILPVLVLVLGSTTPGLATWICQRRHDLGGFVQRFLAVPGVAPTGIVQQQKPVHDLDLDPIDIRGIQFRNLITTSDGWTYEAAQLTLSGVRQIVTRTRTRFRIPYDTMREFVQEWNWKPIEPRRLHVERERLPSGTMIESIQINKLPLVGYKHSHNLIRWEVQEANRCLVRCRPTPKPPGCRIPSIKGSSLATGSMDMEVKALGLKNDECVVERINQHTTGLFFAVPDFFLRKAGGESISRDRRLAKHLFETSISKHYSPPKGKPKPVGCLTRWIG